jgi:hypothetical protein
VEEEELGEFLAADDDLNLSDEQTHDKPSTEKGKRENEKVSFDILDFTPANFPELNNDIDSVSTFHPNRAQPKQPKVTSPQNSTDMHTEYDSLSKMSDTAATISTLKSTVSDLNSLFKQSFNELNEQSKKQAAIQKQQGEALQRLLEFFTVTNGGLHIAPPQSEVANNPQTQSAGDSQGVTGHY